MEYLDFLPDADCREIRTLLQEKLHWLGLGKKGVERFRLPYERVKHLRAHHCDFSGDVVKIGRAEELSPSDTAKVYGTMRDFMPWRKGPFKIFGVSIDAEWRSERKWSRVAPELPDLKNKIVADIGCNNGYYMFRMVPYRPKFVLGFEPYLQHFYAFKTLNAFAGVENLAVEPIGVEHVKHFRNSFDVVFLMGILYHRSAPLEVLRDILEAMRPQGTLIVESQGIPGETPQALFPAHRYAKVPGTYFVPTGACLVNWLSRAGFTDVKMFCSHPMSSLEQRKTEWMTFESYEDFIDKTDPALTVEGYPAPVRIFAKAVKG